MGNSSALDTGNTAWILVSTALVLFMTLPGLALFYGGLVRAKNVLSVLMQCFAITALVTLVWLAFGYSVAFEPSGYEKGVVGLHSFVGGPDGQLWFNVGNAGPHVVTDKSGWTLRSGSTSRS